MQQKVFKLLQVIISSEVDIISAFKVLRRNQMCVADWAGRSSGMGRTLSSGFSPQLQRRRVVSSREECLLRGGAPKLNLEEC